MRALEHKNTNVYHYGNRILCINNVLTVDMQMARISHNKRLKAYLYVIIQSNQVWQHPAKKIVCAIL